MATDPFNQYFPLRLSPTPSTGRGVSLGRLLYLGSIHEPDRDTAAYVTVSRVWKENPRNPSILRATTTTRDPANTPPYRTHYQRVWSADPKYTGRLSETRPKAVAIKASCTCDRWMYVWEYAAYRHYAADIFLGNGQPARQTNPANQLACCKHLIKVLRTIRSRNL